MGRLPFYPGYRCQAESRIEGRLPFYLVKKAALKGRLPIPILSCQKGGPCGAATILSWQKDKTRNILKKAIFYPILSCQKRRPFRGGSHSILATGGIQNLWVLPFCQDRMAAAPHLEVLNPFYPGKRRNPEYPGKKSMKSDGKNGKKTMKKDKKTVKKRLKTVKKDEKRRKNSESGKK